MSQPFVGEIRLFGGNFAPAGWAFCNGATLPISEYETLFNLIGTTYGAMVRRPSGFRTCRPRAVHQCRTSSSARRGVETVTLTTPQVRCTRTR